MCGTLAMGSKLHLTRWISSWKCVCVCVSAMANTKVDISSVLPIASEWLLQTRNFSHSAQAYTRHRHTHIIYRSLCGIIKARYSNYGCLCVISCVLNACTVHTHIFSCINKFQNYDQKTLIFKFFSLSFGVSVQRL